MKGCLSLLVVFLLHTVNAINFDVTDEKTNKTCLFARMNAVIHIPYTMENKDKNVANITVEDRATSSGKCAGSNGTEASLTIAVSPINSLKMDFIRKEKDTLIDSIEYSFTYYKADFPDLPANMFNKSVTVSAKSLNMKLADEGTYYRCISPEPLQLMSADKSLTVQLELSDESIQVFDIVDGKMSENKTECTADRTTHTTQTTHHTTPNTTHHNTTHHTTHSTTHHNTTHHSNHTTHHTTAHTTPATTAPPTAHWFVRVNNTVCIIAEMNISMTITYNNEKNKSVSQTVMLPETAIVDDKLSSCASPQVLVLSFFDDWSIRFNLTEDKSSTYVTGVELNYKTGIHLPDAYKNTTYDAQDSGLKLFKSTKKNYYKCDASESQGLGGSVELKFTNVKFQAYRDDNKNNTDLSGTAEECVDDEKTSAIVPIVVGAALAALVVIVLIAYLVGRRRRQSGYESV